jgi:hypothetical protein
MARTAYSSADRAAAVTLARVIGAEAASKQLRLETAKPYDKRSIRGWMAEFPDLPIEASDWRKPADLALARATSMIATGRMTAVQVATVAAIATRNASREPAVVPDLSALAARDELEEWVTTEYLVDELYLPLGDVPKPSALAAADDAIADIVARLRREVLRRANDETVPRGGSARHRTAVLTWFSGRVEDIGGNRIPAGDVLQWSQGHVRRMVARHGGLMIGLDRAERVRGRWEERRRTCAQRARAARS